jgi:pyrroline-5-carboxylate reductase
MFEGNKIAFIGAGIMGGTMIEGLIDNKMVTPDQIVAADPHEARGNELVAKLGIHYTSSNTEAVEGADVLVLSVKPQQLERVLHEIRGRADSLPLILSIVAGIKIRSIAEDVHNSRIVRAMPNTPGQIGEGISVWTATYEVLDEQRTQAQAILSALGDDIFMEDERYLDMATALSGSGPGFVFMFIEAMVDAGVRMGFSRKHSEQLVLQTFKGSILYAIDSGTHPTILRNNVTSPGGTTAAGLFEMEKQGFRTAVAEAVWAAYQRSMELGDSDD